MRWRLTELRGECVEPGYAHGYVRALGAPRGPDDILVASAVEPWDVPELLDCKAVVLEHGGTTSHAAIVARELSVPMLVGVAGALATLPPGSHVFIDSEFNRLLLAEQVDACAFCDEGGRMPVWAGSRLRVIEEAFPVVRRHFLVIPRRHVESLDGLDGEDWTELGRAVDAVRERVGREHGESDLNLVMNAGPAAGQTVAHVHWHLLFRRQGDDPEPRGGARRIVANPLRPYPEP